MVQEYDLGNVRGATGPMGPQGPQGPQGPVGPLPRLTVGNTVTLPPGAAASVTRREGSPDSAPVWDFAIPSGGGGMEAAVYDPHNRHQDIFAYIDQNAGRQAATVVVAAADSADKNRADYVCTGSGDQLVLKTAINSLPASGGKVLLLDGTYHLDAGSTIPEGNAYRLIHIVIPRVTICGMGCSTILRLDDAVAQAGNTYHLLWVSAADFQLSNLVLDGNAAANSGGVVEGLRMAFQAENSVIASCVIKNCADCGLNIQAENAALRHNFIHDCGDGMRLEGSVDAVCDNLLSDNSGRAIYASGGRHFICGNRLNDNQTAGIYCEASSGDLIVYNYLVGHSSGISLHNCAKGSIWQNYIRRNLSDDTYASSEYSIYLEACSQIVAVVNRVPGKALQTAGSCTEISKYFSGTDWNFNG